jgi:hypothetical protein
VVQEKEMKYVKTIIIVVLILWIAYHSFTEKKRIRKSVIEYVNVYLKEIDYLEIKKENLILRAVYHSQRIGVFNNELIGGYYETDYQSDR